MGGSEALEGCVCVGGGGLTIVLDGEMEEICSGIFLAPQHVADAQVIDISCNDKGFELKQGSKTNNFEAEAARAAKEMKGEKKKSRSVWNC